MRRWRVGASGSSGSAAPASRRTPSSRARGAPRSAAGTASRRRTCARLEGVEVEIARRAGRAGRAGRSSSRARTRPSPGTPRAEFLAELVSLRRSIVVAGAHGKTTTTGMIAFVLAELGLDPAWLVGGEIAAARRQRGRGGGLARRRGGRVRPDGRAAAARDRRRHERRARPPLDVRARRPRSRRCSTRWLAEVPQVVRGWELEPVVVRARGAGRAQPAERRGGARRARARRRRARRRRAGARALPRRRPALRARRRARAASPSSTTTRTIRPRSTATIAAARERTAGRVLVLFQPHLYSRTRHLAHELGAALSTRRRAPA